MLHFEDRTRIIQGGSESGEFILYWMRTAVRTDHNPALVTALELAQRHQKPLLVYHAISERYPYASARHHTFIMEGAKDIAKKFQALHIPYVFHVEREGHRGPHLETLAKRSIAVVTEDMPVPFLAHWTEALAERTLKNVYLVDTDCIVPMKLSKKAPTRAFQFRDRFKAEREHRLHNTTFPPLSSFEIPLAEISLPFEPVDLEHVSFGDILKDCAIDHSVLPVPHTKGGADAAQERWAHYKKTKLHRYHKERNNPLMPHSVSRMSAYLHYGMISSFQLATESLGYGAGGEKYRDELLIWRELAHHWCFHTAVPQHWMSLPQWARETLEQHQNDPREYTVDWQTLRHAQTEDTLWNACQTSLNLHGELHNNLRMTWGKQLLTWFDNPRKALRMTLDLNNRFALDGRDPSSYGGILWCFGLFDRPFTPPQNVWGTIRERTCEHHASRLNVDKYTQQITLSPFKQLSIRSNLSPFVTCLLQQTLALYNIELQYTGQDYLILPTDFGSSHQSKLIIASWIDADWLNKANETLTWTNTGNKHWQDLWSTIPQIDTDQATSNLRINNNSLELKTTCPIDQFQQAMGWIVTQLQPSTNTMVKPQQIQLW